MLSDKIKNIQVDITNLENISGFKKMVAEHTRISGDIQTCITSLDELAKTLDSTNENNNTNIMELTDDQYNDHVDYLKTICDVFDQMDNIEDQMPIYIEAMKKVKEVEKYLENRKLEIVKI